jgi:hypothetical protein
MGRPGWGLGECLRRLESLDIMDSYKIALPASLAAKSPDKCITFCSNNSCLVTCEGLPKDICSELLSILLESIFTNFRACARPEGVCSIFLRVDRSINEIHKLRALFSTKVFYKTYVFIYYWHLLCSHLFYKIGQFLLKYIVVRIGPFLENWLFSSKDQYKTNVCFNKNYVFNLDT